jgi:hypothetical protein
MAFHKPMCLCFFAGQLSAGGFFRQLTVDGTVFPLSFLQLVLAFFDFWCIYIIDEW